MRPAHPQFLASMLAVALLCSACSSLFERLNWWGDRAASPAHELQSQDTPAYGSEADVHGTVDIVKAAGEIRVLTSHAVQLPIHPLQAVTEFNYAFPGECGGHQFRVYESAQLCHPRLCVRAQSFHPCGTLGCLRSHSRQCAPHELALRKARHRYRQRNILPRCDNGSGCVRAADSR